MAKKQNNNIGEKKNTLKQNADVKQQTVKSDEQDKQQGLITEVKPIENNQKQVNFTYEQISERARSIWYQRGCPTGEDEKNWFEAERQLKHELSIH